MGYQGECFTWEKSRGTDWWIQERLDRGLANKEWVELFPSAIVKVMEVSTSDHFPLYLALNRQVFMPKVHRFRFENMWVKEDDCRNLVLECWNSIEGSSIMDKMAFVCSKLEEWGGGMLKNMRDQIQNCKKDLRKYRSRRDEEGIRKYNRVRWEYMCLLEKQEIYWKQRAKQFWLREGDKNTRFFHKFASGRKEHNSIKKLKDTNGVWKESDEEIQETITEYFEQIFQTSGVNEGLSDGERVRTISADQNDSLLMPVTSEEVKSALFSMYPEKAPGIDGLNPGFFQAFWPIVANDVTNFCQDFMMTGKLPERINRTLVCLIPKIKHPKQMTDYRPIALCNVLVRILSKVITNRLKPCLKDIISENQSAFLEGRLLTDNAIIAFEINHYIHRRTQGKTGVAGLKIDISKAYDRLEWCFLENMLRKMGFHQIWISRLMAYINSVSYSFVRDGVVFGEVKPQRGLRQGDPISPYLYILCAEGLSAMLRRHEEMGMLHGCKIARGAPSVSHLLFADDCYLFFKATRIEASTVKNILNRYERCSGQAVNYRKSSIIFSPNTNIEERREMCTNLEVEEVDKPGKYLGMPMSIGKNKRAVFGFLVEKIDHKLQGWANKELSKQGKLTLLKSAAQSIPNFWMSLFLLPHSICDDIEKLMNGFWWGKGSSGMGIRWFSWENLSKSKMVGGLGVKSLSIFNVSMLAKQGWRLINKCNPLVSAIMKAKYYPKTDFLNAEMGGSPSYIWRSMLAAKDVLKANCRRKIGDGASTFIWKVP